ncbi:NfeD family protein [Paenibacillus aurantius]|uniref:NfeD family protein n=1 Tax=Paenibacillus aurantius TaxID=2918900 RepID=A0AA96LEF8_9BACL|nr:NfeD family protein [Paenibacillus aurantius]WJH35306.1 NfeD family protein [Paenibacillus sp. CC-CFT747]WNQ10576.1 NfeD family protein [Paenibacillus aurantius]
MAWVIWLVIGAALIVAEMFTLTFYLLWLGIGALVAALFAWIFPDWLLVQAVAGSVTALALTVLTKPLARRVRASRGYKDAIDDLVGKQGLVTEDIHVGKMGIVKVGSESWSATSTEPLVKGEPVIVVHRGNAVLQVEKWGRL